MPRFSEENSACEVHVFKDGLLSALGHDLILDVTKFSINLGLESGHVGASFDASSLRVRHALAKDGSVDPEALTDEQKTEIEENIRKKVLHPDRFPEVHFVGTKLEPSDEGFLIQGKLHLHGEVREVAFSSESRDGKQVVDVSVHQPDYGIKPYRALMGALRIKPGVVVRLTLPFG